MKEQILQTSALSHSTTTNVAMTRLKEVETFTFVVHSGRTLASNEQDGLTISQSRSHVARMAHLERKRKNTLSAGPSKRPLQPANAESRIGQERGSEQHDRGEIAGKSRSRSLPLNMSNSAISTLPIQMDHLELFPDLPPQLSSDVSSILVCYRDIHQPTIFFSPFYARFAPDPALSTNQLSLAEPNSFITSSWAQQLWTLTVHAFHGRASAFACISMCASTIAPCCGIGSFSSRIKSVALQLRVRSSEALRHDLQSSIDGITFSTETILGVFWLSLAEIRAGNDSAAAVHDKWLSPYIRLYYDTGRVESTVVVSAVIHSIHVAIQTSQKVQIGTKWIAKSNQSLWNEFEHYLLISRTKPNRVSHQSIPIRLQSWLDRLIDIHQYWRHPLGAEVDDTTRTSVFFCALTLWLYLIGCLCDVCADIMDESHVFIAKRHKVQALVALTSLKHGIVLQLWRDQSACKRIDNRIRQIIRNDFKDVSEDNTTLEALVYVCYMGVISETATVEEGQQTWFRSQLVHHARLCGVLTWPHCEALLDRFFFIKAAYSDGSSWFEDLVQGINTGPSSLTYDSASLVAGLWELSKIFDWGSHT